MMREKMMRGESKQERSRQLKSVQGASHFVGYGKELKA